MIEPQRVFTTSLEVAINKRVCDEKLLSRFTQWKEQSGNSLRKLAPVIGVSYTSLGDYLNYKYRGDIRLLEKKIRKFLDGKEENLQRSKNPEFCWISSSELIWEVLQACDEGGEMGAVIGPSGTSKTKTAKEYQRKNPGTIILTASPTRRGFSTILKALATSVSACNSNTALDDILRSVIGKLKDFRRLIVVDEAMFLKWESFEVIRNVYDATGAGFIYLGTSRLYSEMRGDTRFDWDQIASRLTIRRTIQGISYEDVKMVCNSVYSGLPKGCVDFLYSVSQQPGRLRVMTDLLKKAVKFHEVYGTKLDLNLFKELKNMNDF